MLCLLNRSIHHDPQWSFVLFWILGNMTTISVRLLGVTAWFKDDGGLEI
jgi:hypothetical protein